MFQRIKQSLGIASPSEAVRGGLPHGSVIDPYIEDTIREYRAAADDQKLSETARNHILREACRAATPKTESLAPLFLTRQRLAFAATMPVALLALVGAFLLRAPAPGMASAPGVTSAIVADGTELVPVRLEVSKQDGDIVIQIANGGANHRVYRTETPGGSTDAVQYATASRAFRDRLQSDSNLVFYRVE